MGANKNLTLVHAILRPGQVLPSPAAPRRHLAAAIGTVLLAGALGCETGFAQNAPAVAVVGPVPGILIQPPGVIPKSKPAFADIDGDGLVEALIGKPDGTVRYFRNVGTAEAPTYSDQGNFLDPVDLVTVESYAAPALVDLDGDGDLDLAVGSLEGGIAYFENTGSETAPVFTERTGEANPLALVDVYYSAPAFADLDGDGDFDLALDEIYSGMRYFENTGSASSPAFTEATGEANPLGAVTGGDYNASAFSDLDGDGDLDLVVGDYDGSLRYFENTGSEDAAVFTEQSGEANPFVAVQTGGFSAPTPGDYDLDGDDDILVGSSGGDVLYIRNDTEGGDGDGDDDDGFGGNGGGGSLGFLGLLAMLPVLVRRLMRRRGKLPAA